MVNIEAKNLWDNRVQLRTKIQERLDRQDFIIERDDQSHQYKVYAGIKEIRPISVTQILDVIGISNVLMFWASKMQREYLAAAIYDGIQNDAITKDQAFSSYMSMVDHYAPDRHPHDSFRERASVIGNEFHALVEAETKSELGHAVEIPEISDRVRGPYMRWKLWCDQVEFYPVASEFFVYNSEMNYAGQVDCLGFVNRRLRMIDWKTSSMIKSSYMLQIHAYVLALISMGVVDGPIGGYIARFPRDGKAWSSAEVSEESWEENDKAWRAVAELSAWMRNSEATLQAKSKRGSRKSGRSAQKQLFS